MSFVRPTTSRVAAWIALALVLYLALCDNVILSAEGKKRARVGGKKTTKNGRQKSKKKRKNKPTMQSTPTLPAADSDTNPAAAAATASSPAAAASITGSCLNLNNEPYTIGRRAIKLIATPASASSSATAAEALCDRETGVYELTGLRAGSLYDVAVDAEHFLASPTSARVAARATITDEGDDSSDEGNGVDFVVLRAQSKRHTISGTVDIDDRHLASITVNLFRASNTKSPMKRTPLNMAKFFAFAGVTKGEYVVRLSSKLSAKEFDLPDVSVPVSITTTLADSPSIRVPTLAYPVRRARTSFGGGAGDDGINSSGSFFSIVFATVFFVGLLNPVAAERTAFQLLAVLASLGLAGVMSESKFALCRRAAEEATSASSNPGTDDSYASGWNERGPGGGNHSNKKSRK